MPFWILIILVSGVFADTINVHITGFSSRGAYWAPRYKQSSSSVIVWLHGGMGSRHCEKGLTAGLALQDTALQVNAWVVSPSACGENHWLKAGTALVDAMLDSLEQREGIRVDSIKLVGVSDGGLGVAAYSVQGRRQVTRRILVSTFLGLVADPSYLASQPKARRGAWLFLQGGADRLYPATQTTPWMREFCSHLGSLQCLVRIDPLGQHDWTWWLQNRPDWLAHALRY